MCEMGQCLMFSDERLDWTQPRTPGLIYRLMMNIYIYLHIGSDVLNEPDAVLLMDVYG
jgi:hypothetical protein